MANYSTEISSISLRPSETWSSKSASKMELSRYSNLYFCDYRREFFHRLNQKRSTCEMIEWKVISFVRCIGILILRSIQNELLTLIYLGIQKLILRNNRLDILYESLSRKLYPCKGVFSWKIISIENSIISFYSLHHNHHKPEMPKTCRKLCTDRNFQTHSTVEIGWISPSDN